MIKRWIFATMMILFSIILIGCNKDKEIKAEIEIADLDITEVTFNINIIDPDQKISGIIFVRLFNNSGVQVREFEFEDKADLVNIVFNRLDNAIEYTVKVYVTVEKKSLMVGEKTFNLASQAVIEIRTAEDFINMKNNRAGNYTLMNDIDFADTPEDFTFVPPFSASRQFSGTFEGNGYTLKNISIQTGYAQTGVFGQISIGKVSNLVIEDINIGTEETPISSAALLRVGIIAGYVSSATGKIENVTVTNGNIFYEAKYKSDASLIYVGGAVGELRGQMENITLDQVNINMSATQYAGIRLGGVVGLMFDESMIKEITADSSINFEFKGSEIKNRNITINIGGITGQNRATSKSRSVTNAIQTGNINVDIDYGTIEGTTSGSYSLSVGGLSGITSSNFYNAIFSGNITVSHEKNEFETDTYKEFSIGGLFGTMQANLVTTSALKVGGEIEINVSDDVVLRPSLTIGKQTIVAAHQVGFFGTPHLMINGVDESASDTSTIIVDVDAFLITAWIKEAYANLS